MQKEIDSEDSDMEASPVQDDEMEGGNMTTNLQFEPQSSRSPLKAAKYAPQEIKIDDYTDFLDEYK